LKHKHVVQHATFSPDGRSIVTASQDGTARVWDAATGQPVSPLLKHNQSVWYVAFSPDGRRVVTASWDRTARVWNLPDEERPAKDLEQLTELVVGYRLDDQGGTTFVGQASWNHCWADLHRRYPTQFAASAQEISAWHREEATACAAAGLWPGVCQHLDTVLGLEPGNADIRSRRAQADAAVRGQANAAGGRWQEGAADFAKAQEGWMNLQLAGWHAACLAGRGDWAGHRQACAALLRFRGPLDPKADNDRAWYCVRFREGAGDTTFPLWLAQTAEHRDPYSLNTLGAALYRAGRFEDAIGKLEEAIQARRDEGDTSGWLFLALAHQKIGHAQEARAWLTKAQQLLDQILKDAAVPLPWDQQLELKLLRAEAEATIGK
jgi:tetratricopeptide (TPR) repeat protein